MPTSLQASIDDGPPAMADWLAALPDRIEDIAARWNLILGEPFEPGGSCSWVAPATDPNRRDVVLQVTRHHTEAMHEAEALALVTGRGAVQVYAFEHMRARLSAHAGPE